SAVYWNPAGFATGAYFSLVLDSTTARVSPEKGDGGSSSGWLLALGAPMLGLSYSRQRVTNVVAVPIGTAGLDRNGAVPGDVRVTNLVMHDTGITLVQSILPALSVGATMKLV